MSLTKEIAQDNLETHEAYDNVPYSSYAYPSSSPEYLYLIGKLFDMNVQDYKNAKVLELGCASGGNLIPYALASKTAQFTGIDLSAKQIDEGNQTIAALELKNINLKHMSIMDINPAFGKFDYIIVHGIFSWVPEEVREKILQICNDNLSENGLAYVSYNTLPGWNMVKSIRDMILYHTKNLNTPAEKATQARILLNFVKEGMGAGKSPYADFIESETNIFKNVEDSYLLHDHMEETNHAVYLHEFMALADKNNLQYVGDTALAAMFTGNLPSGTSSVLKTIGNDIIKTEQYMDFISNRRFRSTILCHKGQKIDRHLNSDRIKDFNISGSFKLKEAVDLDKVQEGEKVEFTHNNGSNFTVTGKALIQSLALLIDAGNNSIALSDLAKQTVKKIEAKPAESKELKKVIYDNILKLILANCINLAVEGGDYVKEVSKTPTACRLARHQATKRDFVTTRRYNKLNLPIFYRICIQYLDGKNNFEKIVELMLQHVNKGELTIRESDVLVTDPEKLIESTKKFVDAALKDFAKNHLLVA